MPTRTPDMAPRENGNQPGGLILGRRCGEVAAGWGNDPPKLRGMDEGLLVVLFTDVEGSPKLRTRSGDAAARDLLRIHEELVCTWRIRLPALSGSCVSQSGDQKIGATLTSEAVALAEELGDGVLPCPQPLRLGQAVTHWAGRSPGSLLTLPVTVATSLTRR
jgi:hypothetical protein